MSADSTGRALSLLSLLQTHRFWRCADLAERLDVTERTVRRDVDRLRELGYPVASTSGKYGGYRLESGAHMPPLLVDDDEAVALAVGLRYAAVAAIDGMEETSLSALTKIEGLLPHRLRRRVAALHSSVTPVPSPTDQNLIDPESLSVLAAACRDHDLARFDYRAGEGSDTRRLVEPHRLVTAAAGTSLRGTGAATTGAPSGSTASRTHRRLGADSRPARSPTVARQLTPPAPSARSPVSGSQPSPWAPSSTTSPRSSGGWTTWWSRPRPGRR